MEHIDPFEDFDMHELEIEQQKDILLSLYQFDDSFEAAIQASIKSINESIDICQVNHGYYSRRYRNNDQDNWDIVESNMELADKMTEYVQLEEMYQGQLIALSEMRVIYLFKSLEISMKSLIKRAYPKVEVKDFFKWETMKSFFDQQGIKLHELPGYAEVQDLKSLNNNFKHTDELDNAALKIAEFKTGDFWDNVDSFLQRIKPKLASFQEQLSKAVVSERFHFDEQKIDTLADEMRGRMKSEDALKFIETLKAKYNIS